MADISNLQDNVLVSVNTNIIDTNFSLINSELSTIQNLITLIQQTLLPSGSILPFGGNTAPSNALLCNGQEVSRATYSNLFDVIGTTYGSGNGSTTFNVPNLKGRALVGLDSTQTEFNTLGKLGGHKDTQQHTHIQDSHTHTQNSHNHTQDAHNHSVLYNGNPQRYIGLNGGSIGYNLTYSGGGTSGDGSIITDTKTPNINGTTATNQATTATNQNYGAGNAGNLQPYTVVNYIIIV